MGSRESLRRHLQARGKSSSRADHRIKDFMTDCSTDSFRFFQPQFGFVLTDKSIICDDVRVKGIGRSFDKLSESVHSEHKRLASREGGFKEAAILSDSSCPRRDVYFENSGRLNTPVVKLSQVEVGEKIPGPAILIDETQTILVEPACEAKICTESVLIAILYK